MNLATQRYEAEGYDVEYTGASKPYDLAVTKGQDVRRVEIKGSSGEATTVELTSGEVTNSRASVPTDLFVVDGISWERAADGSVQKRRRRTPMAELGCGGRKTHRDAIPAHTSTERRAPGRARQLRLRARPARRPFRRFGVAQPGQIGLRNKSTVALRGSLDDACPLHTYQGSREHGFIELSHRPKCHFCFARHC